MEEILRQVGYLPELYEDARSEKYLKNSNIIFCNFFITNLMHKLLVYSDIMHLLNSSTCFEH